MLPSVSALQGLVRSIWKPKCPLDVKYSPMCSFALAKLSPLLHCAVGLEEGDSITVHMAPDCMHLPAACYHVTLQPMKLVVATRGLLQGVIALLKCAIIVLLQFSSVFNLLPP